MNYQAKMDQTKIPTPIRKLIEVAKEDLLDRYCTKQYVEESSDGIFLGVHKK